MIELILGVIAFGCVLITAHNTQVTAAQLRKLNKTMEAFLKKLR